MEVVRGIGVLCLIFGVAGVLVRFTGPIRMRPSLNPRAARVWPIAGRVGLVLLAVGLLLLLVSLV